ncbi:hypothetical protein IQ06DRAFT_298698 [Phaeosphaeriaceae sp. SRC1lsM3a]|nr:hypothetical protein IQ06DRAFT_298698 [Stagonospora sp. SRC1lsM3a]
MNSNSGRIYQPLPDSQRSLRLIRITPGWPDDEIHVSLVTVNDIDDAPPYVALSYVWGLKLAAKPIVCNGVSKTVTKSLGEALRSFRAIPSADESIAHAHGVVPTTTSDVLHSSRHIWDGIASNRWERPLKSHTTTPLLWIDALCINQDDMDERSNQVKGMRGIYQKASSVWIWFGSELQWPDEGPRGPVPISRLGRLLGRTSLAVYGDMPIVFSFVAQAVKNVEHNIASRDDIPPGFPSSSAPEWKIVRKFLQHPWFYRVWTVQEIAMARTATLFVGDWEINWEDLSTALQYMHNSFYRHSLSWKSKAIWKLKAFDSSWSALPLDSAVYMCRIKSQADKRPLLMGLLNLGRDRGATQPADYVFAVLNLSADWQTVESGRTRQPYIEPNYTKSVVETFTDFSTWLITFHCALDVLSFVADEEQEGFQDCPSWVPVWSCKKRSCNLAHDEYRWSPEISTLDSTHRRLLRSTGYNADLKESLSFEVHRPNILQVKGLVVSSVSAASHPLIPVEDDATTFRNEASAEEVRFIESAWKMCTHLLARDVTLENGTSRHDGDSSPAVAYTTRKQIFEALVLTLSANRDEWGKRADKDASVQDDARAWLSHVLGNQFGDPSVLTKLTNAIIRSGDRHVFQATVSLICSWRCFFVTRKGHMGIGPLRMREGDVIAILFGSTIPFVLRHVEGSADRYMLLGECYIHGIMDGEWVQRWKGSGDRPPQVFNIQ